MNNSNKHIRLDSVAEALPRINLWGNAWVAGMAFFGHKTCIKRKHMLCFIHKYKNYVWEKTLKHLKYEKCQSPFFEYSQEPKTRGYQFLAVHFIQECNWYSLYNWLFSQLLFNYYNYISSKMLEYIIFILKVK